MLKRLLKEPMVYFCLIGALVYYFYIPYISEQDLTDKVVELPRSFVETRRDNFVNQYKRQPTEEELQSIIDQAVNDEILFREAWRLQLYVGDAVVKKRMIQKMKFLLEEGSATSDVSEEALKAYFQQHKDVFPGGKKVDIYHVLFADSVSAKSHLEQLKENGGVPPESTEGIVAFPLGNAFSQLSEQDIAKYFGTDFYENIKLTELNRWQGPIKSRYGFHIVKLDNLSNAKKVVFADVRENIRNRVIEENRVASRREAIAEIKQRYQIALTD